MARSTADLPEPSKRQARTVLVSLGLFWGLWGVAVRGLAQNHPSALGIVAFAVAFISGFVFFASLYRIWEVPFVRVRAPWSREYRDQARVVLSVLDPRFIRRIFRASGWNAWLVGGLLVAFLAMDTAAATRLDGTVRCPDERVDAHTSC